MPEPLSYEDVCKEAEEQLQKHTTGVLATAVGGHVTARSVVFAFEGLTTYFLTGESTRKFKQFSVNNQVAVVVHNVQIEGVVTHLGPTNKEQNSSILKLFANSLPDDYMAIARAPDTIYRFFKIKPKRVALYHVLPDAHLRVIYVDEKKALRFGITDDWSLS